jgi:hypothetical protein
MRIANSRQFSPWVILYKMRFDGSLSVSIKPLPGKGERQPWGGGGGEFSSWQPHILLSIVQQVLPLKLLWWKGEKRQSFLNATHVLLPNIEITTFVTNTTVREVVETVFEGRVYLLATTYIAKHTVAQQVLPLKPVWWKGARQSSTDGNARFIAKT